MVLTLLACAACTSCTPVTFSTWDRDGDQRLTPDEIPAEHRDQFHGADVDDDGFVSREEFDIFGDFLREPRRLRKFEVIRDIPYAGTDNPQQRLDLFMPKDRSRPRPLIIYLHGGGWQQGNKSRGLILLSPYLRDFAYVAASVEYRLTGEASWPAQLHDAKAALRWLRSHASEYGIDPERIAVFGGSAGGHLAALIGLTPGVAGLDGQLGRFTNAATHVSAVVDYCGPSDLVRLATQADFGFGRTNSPETKLLGGLAADRPDLAREASPVYHVTSRAPPFFIAQGTKDSIVPFSQSELLYSALTNAGPRVPPIFIHLAGADHAFLSRELTHRTRQFLALHLLDQPADISSTPIGP